MDAQRFREIESAFEQAVAMTPDERQSFLRDVAASDPALSARVAAMLNADQATSDPMRNAISRESESAAAPLPPNRPPRGSAQAG